MSYKQDIIGAVYNLLTADAGLQSLCGGTVRLRYMWAKPDEVFPYLVHKIDVDISDPVGMLLGRYVIDIWDYNETAENMCNIRGLVVQLLDERIFDTTGTSGIRFYLESDYDMPEPTEGIWRGSLAFNIRAWRSGDVETILNRSE